MQIRNVFFCTMLEHLPFNIALSRYALKMAEVWYGEHERTMPTSMLVLVGVTVPPYVAHAESALRNCLLSVVIKLFVVSESW